MTTEVKLTCLPYFYVIGVSQCGTKDLFERLTQHPLVSGNVKPGNRWFTRLRYGKAYIKSIIIDAIQR